MRKGRDAIDLPATPIFVWPPQGGTLGATEGLPLENYWPPMHLAWSKHDQ